MEELNLIRRWWLEWRNRWNSIAGSAILRLGDASGESKLSVRNSDDQEVFYVRSDGRTSVEPGEGADGEALLRGGGRSLLGNLAVAADVTIDGVDISAFKSSVDSWQNTHVQTGSDPHPQYITASTAAGTYARGDTSVNGTNGLSGGGALGTGTNTLNLSVNAGYAFAWTAQHSFGEGAKIAAGKSVGFADTFGTVDAEMKRVSANTLALGDGDQLQSTDFSSGAYGYRIDASGNAEFNNVRIRGELASTVFRFNEVSATAGTLGVYYSASTVHAEFTTPSALNGTVNAQIKNSTPSGATALFASGDRLQVRVWNGTALVTAWFTVDAAPTTATGYSTYLLRLQSGSTSAVVPAGTAIVDWGTASGGGAVTLSADGTIGAAPNISVLTTAGSPWSDQTLRARLGNLNGSYGYAADTFGFATGNSATTFLAVDSANGFRVVRDTTTRFQVDTAGALTIRNTAGAAVITMDSTSARIDNVLNIGTSGEIRQGTGSLTASPATFTGTRIWNDSGVGRIAGYNSGTQQWYAGTDGKLYAGGGNVRLDSSGVSVLPTSATSASGAYVFRDVAGFTTNGFGMFGTSVTTGGNTYMSLEISNYGNAAWHEVVIQSGNITFSAYSGTGINNGSIAFNGTFARFNTDVRIAAGLSVGVLSFDVPTGDIYASGNVHGQSADFNDSISAASASFTTSVTIGTSSGGLNVGTTGAGAGAIKAAAGISGVDGTFTGGLNVGTATGATAGSAKVQLRMALNGATLNTQATMNVCGQVNAFPAASGLAGEAAIRVRGGNSTGTTESGTVLDISASGSAGQQGGWMQARNSGDYSLNYQMLINPNGGNVGIGTTSPGYTLDVDGSGRVRTSLIVGGDIGSGLASHVIVTNGNNVAANSTGTGTIKFKGTTSRDSSGFIKIYVGTTVYWVPFFSAVTG